MKIKHKKIRVVTHNGFFHTDETLAVALLKAAGYRVSVKRVPHNVDSCILASPKYDMILDVGLRYDGVRYFDHHQGGMEEATAGLVYNYLVKNNLLPEVRQLREMIKLLDRADNGIVPRPIDSIVTVVRNLNCDDAYSRKQKSQFKKAVAFLEKYVVIPMLEYHKKATAAALLYKDIKRKRIVWLDTFHPLWMEVFNGESAPNVEAVVYRRDGKVVIQLTPVIPGSYITVGKPLPDDPQMVFVHKKKFLAVAPSEEVMAKYIMRYLAS